MALALYSHTESCPGPFILHIELPWPHLFPHRVALGPSFCAQSCTELPWPLPLAKRAALAPISHTQSCPQPWPLHLMHRVISLPQLQPGHYISYISCISYFSEKCKKCNVAVKKIVLKNLYLAHMTALAPLSGAQICPGPFILRTELPWPLHLTHRVALSGSFIQHTEWL